MNDLPKRISINEEGPREGFQIESASISTASKIELIDALSETGLGHMQIVSFVNPKAVPGMADAEEVVAGITQRDDVQYTALWLNERGYDRALKTGRLHMEGALNLYASEAFLQKNQNRTSEQQRAAQDMLIQRYLSDGVPLGRGFVSAAFGCNFEGSIEPQRVVELVGELITIAEGYGLSLPVIGLGDTMGWATPEAIRRVVGAVRDAYPQQRLSLHLHDTRGMGIANAFAGLQMGVDAFDSCVAGLGGCPFAGNKGAAGNVCTEDLVFMCDEMAIETGVNLDALIRCARLAEEIVGHALPGSVMVGGGLSKFRDALSQRG